MTTPAITRYPLAWPPGRVRATHRQRPKFAAGSFAPARDGLLAELRRAKAADVVLSTNVELRRDGLPLAGQRQPADPGVAVYFRRKGKDLAFACDCWATVEQNMRALADVIGCIRTIERRGTGDMVDAAFTGFAALPPAASSHPAGPLGWWEVLGVHAHTPTNDVIDAYRKLVLRHHPDRTGGDDTRMKEVNAAYERFRAERGL